MFKACVFDLDGTLIDSFPGISYAFHKAMSTELPKIPAPDVKTLVGPPVRKMFQLALPMHASETLLDRLEQSFRQTYDSVGWKKTQLYDNVEKTLASLKSRGVLTFVLTNKPLHSANKILSAFGLSRYFQAVIGRESRSPAFTCKTQAAEYLTERFNLRNQRTILVGDSEDDAHAAQHCKFSFAAADYGYGQVSLKTATRPDYRLTKLADLATIIDD
jgi:phosphoglycolate phosphatase